jgi:hypothetical protein
MIYIYKYNLLAGIFAGHTVIHKSKEKPSQDTVPQLDISNSSWSEIGYIPNHNYFDNLNREIVVINPYKP